jgi:hypothetical protein
VVEGTDPLKPSNRFACHAKKGATFSRMILFWKISEAKNLSLSGKVFCFN